MGRPSKYPVEFRVEAVRLVLDAGRTIKDVADSLEIGFNANYLKDILHQIDGDTVELHLADPGAPTLIRQDDKSAALYVLMPMRV